MTRLFGTNGIRGVVNKDMNSELALGIGNGVGHVSKNKRFLDRNVQLALMHGSLTIC